MKLIICVDDHLGYSFNKRKQSSDRVMKEHLQERLKALEEDYSLKEGEKEWFWLQKTDFPENIADIDELMIYRWNRTYPYDKKLPDDLLDGFTLMDREEFKGSSHDRISFEHYVKEDIISEGEWIEE